MGGAASNVPVELAWKRVRDGKIGTRNACFLAFDCFHPQWDSRHLWLAPILQAIQVQMLRNLDYAKSERDVLTLSLALGFSSELGISGALNPGVTSRDDAPDGEILASPTVAATLAPVAVMEPATTTLDPAPTASSFESPEVNAALAVAGAAVWVTYTDHEG